MSYDVSTGQGIQGSTGSPAQLQAAKAYRGSTQSISDSSETALSFSATEYNYGTLWAVGSPTKLTAQTAGVYAIEAWCSITKAAGGRRYIAIRVNGNLYPATQTDTAPNATYDTQLEVGCQIHLNVGDYIEVVFYQNSSGALNTGYNVNYPPYVAAYLVRPDSALAPTLSATLDACRVYRSVTTSATGGGATDTISFDTLEYNYGNTLWVVGTPTRITAVVAGVYQVSGEVISDTGTAGTRTVSIVKGVSSIVTVRNSADPNGNRNYQNISCGTHMAVGDYLTLTISKSDAGAGTYLGGQSNCWMSATLIRPD